MKVIVAPDKFKGSLTSFEVCGSIQEGIQQADPSIEVLSFPMADGGDGFAAVMQHYLRTETIYCDTVNPLGRAIKGSYQWSAATKTAIVELAVASGLVLLKEQDRNPMKTSTYGTGVLIKEAIKKGAKKIILGLGGSATNDAGIGILSALGFNFIAADKSVLRPVGEKLSVIETIIPPLPLPPVEFKIACDVQNPLYGPDGAAYIYAQQKGATADEVRLLDNGLRHFAVLLQQLTGKQVAGIAGTGAAGGIAAGLIPYFNVTITSGTELVIEASGIRKVLPAAALVITGEGRIDEQSKEGKVVSHIAALVKGKNIPVIGLCGKLQLTARGVQELGLHQVVAIMNDRLTLEESMKNAAVLLSREAKKITPLFLQPLKK